VPDPALLGLFFDGVLRDESGAVCDAMHEQSERAVLLEQRCHPALHPQHRACPVKRATYQLLHQVWAEGVDECPSHRLGIAQTSYQLQKLGACPVGRCIKVPDVDCERVLAAGVRARVALHGKHRAFAHAQHLRHLDNIALELE
jgi:hypothetical protein